MKLLALLTGLCLTTIAGAQTLTGTWINIDDEDGKPKSHIEISEANGKLTGTVVKLLPAATLSRCTKCKGDRADQPIQNMVIMWDLELKDGRSASGGRILDPKTGKEYDCKISLSSDDVIDVRGYIGSPLFGRSQQWHRAKS